MANCNVCKIIESGRYLYKDDKVIVYMDDSPSSPGHIVIAPVKHYPIIEEVPDYVVDQMFQVANKMSMTLFEVFKAQGTNVIVNNGIEAGQEQPHVTVNIIPRMENDSLNFSWVPKQLSEEEMSTIELNVKEAASSVGGFEKEPATQIIEETEVRDIISDDEENYLIKQIRRLP